MKVLLEEIVRVVPGFWGLISGLVVLCAGQAFLLRVLQNQRRSCLSHEDRALAGELAQVSPVGPSFPWAAVLCGSAPLMGGVLLAVTLATARALVLPRPGVSPEIRGNQISRGLGGMLNVVPFGVYFLVPSILMAAVAIGLGLTTHLRTRRIAMAARLFQSDPNAAVAALRHGRPGADNVTAILLAYAFFGVFPVLMGALNHSLALIRALADSARLSREGRMNAWLDAFAATHADFASLARLAWVGTALATAIAIAVAVRWRRRRPPTTPPSLSWRFSISWSISFLLVAISCFLIAAPYRAENRLPWPHPRDFMFGVDGPKTPSLDGPDEVDLAPILEISSAEARLDGRNIDAPGVERELKTTRQNYFLVRPGEPYLGRFLVLCSPDTSAERLHSFLLAAYRTGHRSAVFTFINRDASFRRPILGEFPGPTRGAATTLVLESELGQSSQPGIVVLPSQAFASYAQLAKELVTLRRVGKDVHVGL